MATIWLLIAISNGGYNGGTLSSVEFSNKQACLQARQVIKENGPSNVETMCVPKDGIRK